MTDTAAAHTFDVDQQGFENDVMKASLSTPVLLDFWAGWCEPCKTLGPTLEKLADEYNGAFRVGKVDVEAQQELAAMFGIRSIPTVVLVKDGQVLDGFAGALPEGEVREFLGRHLQPLELPAEAAVADEAVAETPELAINRLQQAIATQPDKAELKLDLAVALMDAGQNEGARSQLDALPANLAADARALRLQNRLELADALQGAPSLDALRQRVQDNPEDWEAHDQMGVQLLHQGDAEAALQQFLLMLKHAREWKDGQAKRRLLAAFATIDDDVLVSRYRRQMASMLF